MVVTGEGLMGLERERVAAWLDEYSRAWQSYDADAIGELFSEDATYRYHPWDEPLWGRAAIVASWVGDQDPPGTYEGRYQPLAVDGDLAVATGRSRYFAPDGSVEREYHNCFMMRFDGDGRCADFTEWFMKHLRDADA
jgi:ketosteroid isomerase-like protein